MKFVIWLVILRFLCFSDGLKDVFISPAEQVAASLLKFQMSALKSPGGFMSMIQKLSFKGSSKLGKESILWEIQSQLSPKSLMDLENEWSSLTIEEILGIDDEPVCYDELGCFPPATGCLSLVYGIVNYPKPPNIINTTFFFYSGQEPAKAYIVTYDLLDKLVKAAPFDPEKATTIIVHGFQAKYDEENWMGVSILTARFCSCL